MTHGVHLKPGSSERRPMPHRPRIRRRAQFSLELDDGRSVRLRGRCLIGRAPAVGADVDHRVALADSTFGLSRTHLEFGIGEGGLWVCDCGSTNGSEIEINGRRSTLAPGLHVPVPPDSTVHFGGRRLTVRAIAGGATIGAATVEWGAASQLGVRRKENQDSFCTTPPAFIVADGMGGHCAGGVASQYAVEALRTLSERAHVTVKTVMACLDDARARIDEIAVGRAAPPGTTVSGVIVTEEIGAPSWIVVNIGDSRTYGMNTRGFWQITVDHSVVQEAVDRGTITAAESRHVRYNNLLSRALIAGSVHPVDVWLLPMVVGDRMLVCSDGITRELDDEMIANVLRANGDPLAAATNLVLAAADAGGRDDMTAVVVDAVAVRSVRDCVGTVSS
ncbi:MAG: protein phosphatase 2C domain-containing protein [Mycobacterium sp.]